MLRYEARSSAPPEVAWALIARPGLWRRWAPQLRGAWGLGTPEVVAGSRGFARLIGLIPIPVRITAKAPGRSWSWRVASTVDMNHHVERQQGGGCRVVVTVSAPAPVEAVLSATYGPVVKLLVGRLARVAEEHAATAGGDVLP